MKYYVAVLVSALVPLAFANPVMVTVVNEFGFDDQGLGWVELHAEPFSDSWDLTGWLVETSTSVCTLDCQLPYDGFLIVDSASLATGGYGRGSFRLNPAGDRIRIQPDSSHSWFTDSVVFPVIPPGRSRAPMPPAQGSAALLNVAGAEQLITWYIDSTPTPEADNDDYSSVTGKVFWAPGRGFYQVGVVVRGPLGWSYSAVMASGQSYLAEGLSAGRYAVTAHGQPGNVVISYPESVDVGYSDTLAGINLDFDPHGVEETMNDERGTMNVRPTVLSGTSGVKRLASCVVFDAMGRRAAMPRSGVYFVRDEGQGTRDVSRMRKVVVTR